VHALVNICISPKIFVTVQKEEHQPPHDEESCRSTCNSVCICFARLNKQSYSTTTEVFKKQTIVGTAVLGLSTNKRRCRRFLLSRKQEVRRQNGWDTSNHNYMMHYNDDIAMWHYCSFKLLYRFITTIASSNYSFSRRQRLACQISNYYMQPLISSNCKYLALPNLPSNSASKCVLGSRAQRGVLDSTHWM
jgi:hypothetical protein